MPTVEAEAVVLRSYPLGEGDRLVCFLSRENGKVRGVARGARLPKSRFGSCLETASHIRIWYYERETRDLVRINQCELVESFLDVQADYHKGVALALICEVTDFVLPDHEPAGAHFRLVLLAAHSIRQQTDAWLSLAYFSLWTVRLAGWFPSLEACGRCGEESRRPGSVVAPGQVAFLCANCRLPGAKAVSSRRWTWRSMMLHQEARGCGPEGIGVCRRERTELDPSRLDRIAGREEIELAQDVGRRGGAADLKAKVKLQVQRGLTFQDLILKLERFWSDRNCILQQPYDVEVGAGTMHPETFLECSDRSHIVSPTCSRVVGPPTVATGKIRIASSNTTRCR